MTTMTRDEQKEFVESMLSDLRSSMLAKIKVVPEDWNGIELRQLFADEADKFVWSSMVNKRSKRYRDYRNVLLVNCW